MQGTVQLAFGGPSPFSMECFRSDPTKIMSSMSGLFLRYMQTCLFTEEHNKILAVQDTKKSHPSVTVIGERKQTTKKMNKICNAGNRNL